MFEIDTLRNLSRKGEFRVNGAYQFTEVDPQYIEKMYLQINDERYRRPKHSAHIDLTLK